MKRCVPFVGSARFRMNRKRDLRASIKSKLVLLPLSGLALTVILHGYRPQETSATGTWVAKGSMQSARSGACAAVLPDGRVMITGGLGPSGSLDTSEVFGMNGSFSNVPAMSASRNGHTCMTMADGRVLVAGGRNENGPINTAEIYNPETNRWSQTSVMSSARAGHTSTLLSDGRVVMAGGEGSAVVNDSIEIFDPEKDKFEFVSSGLLSSARKDHAAALLPDGRVLIAGGSDGKVSLSSTDIFDPRTGTVEHGAKLSAARAGLSAVALLDGGVRIAGGNDGEKDLSSAEIYDPAANKFAATEPMTAARKGQLAFRLPNNNQVLLIGGDAAGNTAELFTPWQGTFQKTGGLPEGHSGAAATPMSIDGVLVLAGGKDRAVAVQSSHVYRFATLKTDQESYVPGATATITGTNWVPGERVTLQIQDVAGKQAGQKIMTTADAAGDITAEYQMGKDAGTRYTITGVGNRAQAPGVLQANPAANLSQCADGVNANATGLTPAQQVTATCTSATFGGGWVNGNVNGSKASYYEGDSLPYQTLMTSLSKGQHTVIFEWDTTKGGKHALDYLTTFNRTVQAADPCAGSGLAGCNKASPTDNTKAIPVDSQVVNQIPGNFTMYGGTIDSVSGYSYPDGTGFAGDKTARLSITFTAPSTNSTVILAWAGHIATRADWGDVNSAVAIGGSPFHTRLIGLDGSGGNQDRALALSAVIFPGSITIIKAATPVSGTFSFTATPAPPLSNFSLSGGSPQPNNTTDNTKLFSNLVNFQTYTISEALSGWKNDSIACTVTGGQSTSAPNSTNGSGSISLPLQNGDNYICTFANTQLAGIHIRKATQAAANDATSFTFTKTGSTTYSGTVKLQNGKEDFVSGLAPGSYSVTESSTSGWDLTKLE